MKFFLWLRSLGGHDDHEGGDAEAAITQARHRLAHEKGKTERVGELVEKARDSRRRNHYAQALWRAYGGRHA